MKVPRLPGLQRLPPQSRTILLTTLYGLCGGLAAVAFQLGLNALYRGTIVRFAPRSPAVFLVGSFVVIMSTSLAAGFLLDSFCREAAGSGIPQVKLAFWKEFAAIPWRAVWVKFIGGILTVGGGSSLGREGPSVHISGGLASNLAGWLGEPKQNRHRAAAAGAGLAAAFNMPLAAVTFVLEEIIEDLNSRYLGSVLLAGVIGALAAGPVCENPGLDKTFHRGCAHLGRVRRTSGWRSIDQGPSLLREALGKFGALFLPRYSGKR